ncbi:MAG: PKD domain-containing protein, partial [Candidatus Woesearchaeota archaeon]
TTTQYTYTINNDDGTNQIIPQTPNTQITTTHTYQNQGTYNPKITVKDTQGNTATTTCETIKVTNNTPNILLANPGGPYFGYINEQVLFDGSLSVGQISMYVWEFGDGAIISTISPNVAHTYNNIGRYIVTLTVYDSNGNSNTAKTTATIIERTSPINNIIKDLPDRGLLVNHLIIYGIDGEVIRSNDDMTTQIEVKNVGKTKLKNVRVTISIPELGYESRSSLFDLSRGQENDESIILPIYDVPKGVYYVRILIENDDGNTHVKRIKYREIIVN